MDGTVTMSKTGCWARDWARVLVWSGGMVGLAALGTWGWWDYLYPSVTPLFLGAVMVAAWVGGLRAGLLATLLATVVAFYLIHRHSHTDHFGLSHLLWSGSFLVVALLVSALNAARQQAEQLLHERDSRLQLVSQQIPAGLWSIDRNLCLTTLFGAGLRLDARPGDPLSSLFPGRGEDFAPLQAHRRALEGEPGNFELDWQGRTYEGHVEPLRNLEGSIIGVVAVALDITERKRFEQNLAGAKIQAEQATAAKDRFLAILSHELRTPLTPALAAASALEMQDDLPQEVHQDLAVIRRSIELEAMLIDDLLDLTRISRGKLRVECGPANLHTVIRSTLDICRQDIEDKSLVLRVNLEAGRDQVWGDAPRLQQVFWNVLKNAVKFTPERGEVAIRSFNEAGQVVVEVNDSGIGIEPDALERIFDAFEQGQGALPRQFGGLGLGLAICRAIMTVHQGTITARSAGPGLGSTFSVRLPLSLSAGQTIRDQPPSPERRANLRGLRVLLVEDHPTTARIMGRLLEKQGCAVRTASSVGAGLAAAKAERFDVLISDLGLPDGSGHDLLRQVLQLYSVKAVALSGFGMEEDVAKSKAAGFSAHLTKPVDLGQLVGAIEIARQDAAPCET